MRQSKRNIYLTKSLLNHSNIATTLSYIEVDYEHMRTVLHERSMAQGAITFERRVDEQIPAQLAHPLTATPKETSLGQNAEPSQLATFEQAAPRPLNPRMPVLTSPESKPLTQVCSISSERFTLDHALLPVGTG
jgi:hypothetical protein